MKINLLVLGLIFAICSSAAALSPGSAQPNKSLNAIADISALLRTAEGEVRQGRYSEALTLYKQANEMAAAKSSGCKPAGTPFIAGTNYYYDMALAYRVWGKSQVPAIRRGNYRKALAALDMAVKCETTYKQAMRRMKFLEGFLNSDLGQSEASLKAFQEARAFPVGDSNIASSQIDGLIARIKQVLGR